MTLIKQTAEIKEFLLTDANFKPESILPFIPLAEKEILRVLGQDQYAELLSYYESASSGIVELDNLLPMVQRPLVFFAFLQSLDILNVVITNNGIAVVSSSSLVPASESRVKALRQNIEKNAWDNIEALLEFLEKNIDDYPSWVSSDAYAYQYQYLISSATLFNEFVPIKRSRVQFLKMRSAMADVELLKLAPLVSTEMIEELKSQVKSNSISEANSKLLPLLQKSLAYFTASLDIDPKYEGRAIQYAMEAKKILDGDPDSYPTYKSSSVFDETLINYQPFENDEESKIVMF
jgi:hypothetical protein